MKISWLHKNANEKCILFMNGWGCDAQPFTKLASHQYDVLVCYDYHDILSPKEIERIFENYREVHLVAWSLGVYVSNLVLFKWKALFASKIAINGTLQPIDNLRGIPPAVFKGTINGLNQKNLEKFWMRMCGGKKAYEQFRLNLPQRGLEDQKEELIILQNVIQNHLVEWNLFDTALLGTNDMIFPFENLQNAWDQNMRVIEKEGFPHFCFYNWDSWDEILEL